MRLRKLLKNSLIGVSFLGGALVTNVNSAESDWQWTETGNWDISGDNGVIYFRGLGVLAGNCAYSRLEIRETGLYYGKPNVAKMYLSTLLLAKLTGRPFRLLYNKTDGPSCRVSGFQVDW